jgi:hypothetical protein
MFKFLFGNFPSSTLSEDEWTFIKKFEQTQQLDNAKNLFVDINPDSKVVVVAINNLQKRGLFVVQNSPSKGMYRVFLTGFGKSFFTAMFPPAHSKRLFQNDD